MRRQYVPSFRVHKCSKWPDEPWPHMARRCSFIRVSFPFRRIGSLGWDLSLLSFPFYLLLVFCFLGLTTISLSDVLQISHHPEDQFIQCSSFQLPPKVGDFRERRWTVAGRSSHFGLWVAISHLLGRRPGYKGRKSQIGSDWRLQAEIFSSERPSTHSTCSSKGSHSKRGDRFYSFIPRS